jgi:hypothetical protein
MTATLEITPPELDFGELDDQDVEVLPTRETLCGWYCHPVYYCCYHPCYPVYYCHKGWYG